MDEQKIAESRVGTVLHGKWRLERLLGVGGMAAVYEATHRIGRRDAIKILHPSVARSPELRARFEQEAHAVNRFVHPGAVEIRDIDTTEDGAPFMVMELLEGEPLSQRVGRPEGLSIDELLRFTDELLDVLAAAHASGIIHRDVKPDNLFIQSDGRLKVLDFGIARMREGTGKANRTAMGLRLGTLPYMPPEQIRGLPIDARADIFAVGAMLFRLVAGRRVHEAPTEAELASKMLSEPAPPLGTVAPSAPEGLCRIVDRALAFVREQRYPDSATMQADVQAVRKGRHPPFATEALATQGPPNLVRAAADGLAAPSALADAPTSAAAEDGHAIGPLGDAATGATMVGATAGVPVVAPPLDAPTGATAIGGADGSIGPVGAASAIGPVVAAGPATMVSAGVVAPRAAGPEATQTAGGGSLRATGPAIAVVEAAPASMVESSAMPTLVAPPATGAMAEAAGVPLPSALAAPAHVAGAPAPTPSPKPILIVWLAAGAGLVTLLVVVLLWWALSGDGSESTADGSAGPGDAGADAGALTSDQGAAASPRADGRAGAGTTGTRSPPVGASTGPGSGSKSASAAATSATGTAPPSGPTSRASVGTVGGNEPKGKGNKDKDKDKGKGNKDH